MSSRILPLLGLVFCSLGVQAPGADTAWDPFMEIPRAAEVQKATAASRGAIRAPRPRAVRWDLENRLGFVRVDSKWLVIDLDGCTLVEGDQQPTAPRAKSSDADAPERGGRRGARPARGRQATTAFAAQGGWSARHQDFNVVLVGPDGSERAVTTDGTSRQRFGTASWVYGEELGQDSAMWFSPDGRTLAFYAFDVTEVPDYYLLNGLTSLRTTVMDEAYPKPGDPNPIAGLRLHDLDSEATVLVDVGEEPDQYIYDVTFSPDSRHLMFLRMNRLQNHLELLVADPSTGTSRTLIDEKQATWVAHDPELRWLKDQRRFLWSTERSGFRTYELWDVDQGRLAVLGPGTFPSNGVLELIEDDQLPGGGRMLFTGRSAEHPLNQQLYTVHLDGSGFTQLTGHALSHSDFEVAPDASAVITIGQSSDQPPTLLAYCANVSEPVRLKEADLTRVEKSGLKPSELFSFTTADGTDTCYGRIHYPSDFDPTKQWPILVDVYGGPESSALRNNFQLSSPMTEFGFVVVQIDNRGTEGRSKAFEGATYLKLGIVDLDDQAQGIRTLLERHDYLDGERVGIHGHSYGGYMSALALLRHPEVFHVGVAGAPVTDWRNYDTIYTERYMRTPEENLENYDASSCVELAKNLEGRLLLLHGMVDDNVHPSNSWQLVDKLQGLDIPFEMLFFPNSAHGIWSPASRSAKWSFLVDELIDPETATP